MADPLNALIVGEVFIGVKMNKQRKHLGIKIFLILIVALNTDLPHYFEQILQGVEQTELATELGRFRDPVPRSSSPTVSQEKPKQVSRDEKKRVSRVTYRININDTSTEIECDYTVKKNCQKSDDSSKQDLACYSVELFTRSREKILGFESLEIKIPDKAVNESLIQSDETIENACMADLRNYASNLSTDKGQIDARTEVAKSWKTIQAKIRRCELIEVDEDECEGDENCREQKGRGGEFIFVRRTSRDERTECRLERIADMDNEKAQRRAFRAALPDLLRTLETGDEDSVETVLQSVSELGDEGFISYRDQYLVLAQMQRALQRNRLDGFGDDFMLADLRSGLGRGGIRNDPFGYDDFDDRFDNRFGYSRARSRWGPTRRGGLPGLGDPVSSWRGSGRRGGYDPYRGGWDDPYFRRSSLSRGYDPIADTLARYGIDPRLASGRGGLGLRGGIGIGGGFRNRPAYDPLRAGLDPYRRIDTRGVFRDPRRRGFDTRRI